MKKTKTIRTQTRSFGTSNRLGHDASEFYQRRLYENSGATTNQTSIDQEISAEYIDQIHQSSSENMHELPDNSVHLMITSPPYNVGKEYDEDLSLNEYLDLLYRVFAETYRVLVYGGRSCINVANIGRKPYIPLNALITNIMLEIGYFMRGEIIWNKSSSAGTSCAWGSWCSPSNPVLRDVHEYILVFSKEDFKLKAKNRKATIVKDDFLDCTKSIWSFPAESARRVGHPAPFPVELPRRLIELYSYEDDVVLDPFMGSGTTALASVDTKRHWVGYDTSKEYCELTENRLRERLANEPLFD